MLRAVLNGFAIDMSQPCRDYISKMDHGWQKRPKMADSLGISDSVMSEDSQIEYATASTEIDLTDSE